jgi:deoxyadenosine/deoxycytidine kinase
VESRILSRGRIDEKDVNVKYWKDLYFRYYDYSIFQDMFDNYSKNFITLNTAKHTSIETAESIIKYIQKRSNLLGDIKW